MFKFNPVTGKLDLVGSGGGGSPSTPIISKTYAELAAMVAGSSLVPGQEYETQIYTKYFQKSRRQMMVCEYPYETADLSLCYETIVLTAISTNTFARRAVSVTYPTDVLDYDFENNLVWNISGYSPTQTYYLGEQTDYNGDVYSSLVDDNLNNTPLDSPSSWELITDPNYRFRPGWVERRNNVKDEVDIYQDYRRIFLRRYKPDISAIGSAFLYITYVPWTLYLDPNDGNIYICKKETTGIYPSQDDYYFAKYYDMSRYTLLRDSFPGFSNELIPTLTDIYLKPNLSDYVDVHSFQEGNSLSKVSIGRNNEYEDFVFWGDFQRSNITRGITNSTIGQMDAVPNCFGIGNCIIDQLYKIDHICQFDQTYSNVYITNSKIGNLYASLNVGNEDIGFSRFEANGDINNLVNFSFLQGGSTLGDINHSVFMGGSAFGFICNGLYDHNMAGYNFISQEFSGNADNNILGDNLNKDQYGVNFSQNIVPNGVSTAIFGDNTVGKTFKKASNSVNIGSTTFSDGEFCVSIGEFSGNFYNRSTAIGRAPKTYAPRAIAISPNNTEVFQNRMTNVGTLASYTTDEIAAINEWDGQVGNFPLLPTGNNADSAFYLESGASMPTQAMRTGDAFVGDTNTEYIVSSPTISGGGLQGWTVSPAPADGETVIGIRYQNSFEVLTQTNPNDGFDWNNSAFRVWWVDRYGKPFFTGINISTSPGVGKVLTSDANGNGTWEAPSSGSGDMTKAVYDPANIAEQLVGITAIQTLTNKTLNDNTNYIDADALHQKVFLNLGSASTIGMPVQATVWNTLNSATEISKCSKSNSTPCLGLMETVTADGQVGSVRNAGVLTGVDTSIWSDGTILYVDGIGVLTSTKPTGATEYIKEVGTVIRQHATLGVIDVHVGDVKPVSEDPHTTEKFIQGAGGTKIAITGINELLYDSYTLSGTESLTINGTGKFIIL